MSSEEEDYMSDAFLLQCGDVRPGLASKNKQKGHEKEKKEQISNQRNKILPRKQLEKQQRETGLNTSISQSSKGFAMLQKMGYKPGTGIGKSGDGRVEPVSIEVKTGRSGLGKDSEMKRKSSEMNNMRAAMQAKRMKVNKEQADSFQNRMRDRFSDKIQEKDLRTAQKACMQLDQQMGLQEPTELFFWPPNSLLIVQPEKTSDEEDVDTLAHSSSRQSIYNNHPYEDSDDDCDREDEIFEPPAYLNFSTYERMEIVTRYLRNKYRYCIWCGTSYEDEKEMLSHCPGNSADVHD